MISWGTILYGALLSAAAAGLLVFAGRRERRVDLLLASAVSGALGPFLWNAILHRVEGREFFVDAPRCDHARQLAGHRLRSRRPELPAGHDRGARVRPAEPGCYVVVPAGAGRRRLVDEVRPPGKEGQP